MLALRSMNVSFPTRTGGHARNIPLPLEVLDRIAEILYQDSCEQLDALRAFSLVSKQFRKSALALLFRIVSFVVRDELFHEKSGLLHILLDKPHLLCYVHTLHVLRPIKDPEYVFLEDQQTVERLRLEQKTSDLQVIHNCLPFMSRLRRLRYRLPILDSIAEVEYLGVATCCEC
jgi:hypothetical protein